MGAALGIPDVFESEFSVLNLQEHFPT